MTEQLMKRNFVGNEMVAIAAGATRVRHKSELIHKDVFTLTAEPIVLTDVAATGQWGTLKICDMPEGAIMFLGAVIDAVLTLTESQWTDAAAGFVGLGTAPNTDATAIATTRQNIIPVTAIAAMTAQVGPIDAQSAAAIGVDGTGTALDIHLNVLITDAAAHITGGGFITGTVTVNWMMIGDN